MAYVLVLVKTRESWLQLYRVRLLSGWAGSQGGLDLRTTHRLQGKRERWGLRFKPHSSEWGRCGKEEGIWIVYLGVKEKRKRGRGEGKRARRRGSDNCNFVNYGEKVRSVSVQLLLLFVYYHWLPVWSEQPHSQVPAQCFSTSCVKSWAEEGATTYSLTWSIGGESISDFLCYCFVFCG